MIWFSWVLWHINHYRLFNAKSSLCIDIKYIRFGLVGFYAISSIVGYLMPNHSLYIYIKYILLGWVGFYGISTIVDYLMPNPLYKYIIKYIWFGLLGFYSISTIVDYLIPNTLYIYIYIYWIYRIWFAWGLRHIKQCWLFNAKSSLCMNIKHIRFGLLGIHGISNSVGYLMSNPLYA